mmetsp:Transcript_49811/g.89100  ORF Transcript_49811/g.89100 Transcript_49811/m.89100 type:complete len:398 (-) Transcript_49811:376-1569(-)
MFNEWHALGVSCRAELNLKSTLTAGQSFRWREIGIDQFIGVLADYVIKLRQDDGGVFFSYVPTTSPSLEMLRMLREYFQLDVSLTKLYKEWEGGKCPTPIQTDFGIAAKTIQGLRILKQPPEECLMSFVCSQNNNIKRIAGMVEKLATHYGTLIAKIDGIKYYSFPSCEALARAKEQKLRDLGFGYRAKYIIAASKEVQQNNKTVPNGQWLISLRQANEACNADVVGELTKLTGVGRKVADCVALFSLDRTSLVPVDTHVWQMALRYMDDTWTGNEKSSLTAKRYDSIYNFFVSSFGLYCGWAHSILFAAAIHRKELDLKMPNTDGTGSRKRKKEAPDAGHPRVKIPKKEYNVSPAINSSKKLKTNRNQKPEFSRPLKTEDGKGGEVRVKLKVPTSR